MHGIILAGGRGERMGPLTNSTPKPMLKVGGKPILQYQIEQLKEAGINDVLLVEGYLPKVIQDYFGDGKGFGVKIQHLVLEADKGSAGAVREALQFLPESEKDAVLIYGDILSDADITRLVNKHREIGDVATLLCVGTGYLFPDGLVEIEGEYVKGIKTGRDTGLANGAIFALDRKKMLDLLPERGDLSRDVWERFSSEKGKLTKFEHEGYWRNMSNAFDVLQAERDLKLGLFKGGKETASSGSVENK